MNSKGIVNKIGNIFEQTYYYGNVFSEDCTVYSLIRIQDEIYDWDKCTVADTINTVRREGDVRDVMCPMVMKRECKVLR